MMAPRSRSVSRSRALPWQPMQPRQHMKQRRVHGRGAFHSNVPALPGAATPYKPVDHGSSARYAAAAGLQPFSTSSTPRCWQPAPPVMHGYSQGRAWAGKQQGQHQQQQQQQQHQAPKQLKKRLRRARQRRQQRQRKAVARKLQQLATLFAPPAPLLDNEFYMARAERERQQQGVRQMDYFLYPAAAAAGALNQHPAVMFAPAASLATNGTLVAAEQDYVETAALLQQTQQAVSSVVTAPSTPAADEQPLAVGQAEVAATAAMQSHSVAAAAASAAVALFDMLNRQQPEQQLQHVDCQEVSCSQKQLPHQEEQQQQQQQQDVDADNYTVEEVCDWFPSVQASLKSTERVCLPAQVASSQPDAPGFFSVLTRTVSGASSCC